jgi:hypothetical protein
MGMKDHKTKGTKREINEYLCDNKKCKFFGEPTVQGVCRREDPDLLDYKKLAEQEKVARDALRWLKKQNPGKKYITALEAYWESAWLNWSGCLDEVIYLRRENAFLRLKQARKR